MIKKLKAKAANSPVFELPTPIEVHRHIGRLSRELALARRLLRLSQAATAEKSQHAVNGPNLHHPS